MFQYMIQRSTQLRTISLVILSALILCLIPYPGQYTAHAAGLLSISVADGPVGTPVKFEGSGFVSNTIVKLYFSSDAAVTGNVLDTQVNTYELLGEIQTDSTGTLGQYGAFVIPSMMDDGRTKKGVTNGDYYIYVTYTGSKGIQASAQFFVTGPVKVTPNSGRIGEHTLIIGNNLKPNDVIFLYFSSEKAGIGASIDNQVTTYNSLGMFAILADGTFSVPYQIPNRLTDGTFDEDVHGGDYYFYLSYVANRKRIETITRYTVVKGEIKLGTENGAVDSLVTISGKDLRADQQIIVKYDNDLLAIAEGDTATDDAGEFNCQVVIPESTIGKHKVTVTDITGNHPSAWFTVEPSVVVDNPVTAGKKTGIRGFGFSEICSVTLSINSQIASTSPAAISTNYNGSFTASFCAPSSTGSLTMTVTDSLNVQKEVEFTVNAAPPTQSSLSLYPANSQANPGAAGKPVTVSGAGFNPNSSLTLTYENTPPATFTGIQTNAEGSFQYSFEVPGGAAGEHKIDVTDGTNAASIMFVLESTAPPPPIAEIPEVVSGVKPTTRFDWTDVVDDSGVKYTFQVSPDMTFAQVVLEKSGLTVSEYTMKENERLDLKGRQTAYYWRVAAVDGAGNESTWSNAILFYVGSAKSAFPVWAYYLLGGLGAVILIVVAAWIIRVKRNQGKTV